MEFGFWILDFGFWILDFGFWILDFGFWILDFGFWILDFGFWSLDFGFWILDQFSIRSFCGGPKRRRLDFGFWILDFGFWSLDFGFWILDFGFWILDFGVWILDFGFWILDFGLDEALLDIVWILHKIFPCHADSGRRIFFDVFFGCGPLTVTVTTKTIKFLIGNPNLNLHLPLESCEGATSNVFFFETDPRFSFYFESVSEKTVAFFRTGACLEVEQLISSTG